MSRFFTMLANVGAATWLLYVTEGTAETVAVVVGVGIVSVANYAHGLTGSYERD